MYKSFSMELAGRTLTVDIGRVCAQANGAALLKYGETTVLSTVTASDKPRDGIDFFPLSVEYEEKMYSVGKIPGGFNKREGKASENAILTSAWLTADASVFPEGLPQRCDDQQHGNVRRSGMPSGDCCHDRLRTGYHNFRHPVCRSVCNDTDGYGGRRVHRESFPEGVGQG